ncbi:MAG: divalent-cation tolerance protein CutA [Planctomycetales bacterium]|nr:divalent-cation tolerance protein CutA [Planctomycetales bacterium]
MTTYIQITTTTASAAQAAEIAEKLVEQRLVACAQISGPVHSVYRWQGNVEKAEEWKCTAKTRTTLFAAAESAIRQLHTYECPEIIATPIAAGSEAYLEWMESQLVDEA